MIYFVQFGHHGPIKIGTTENVGARMNDFKQDLRMPMAILSIRPGGREEETVMHRRFSPLRLGRTEQFRPGPALTEFLDMRPIQGWRDVAVVPFPDRGASLFNVKLTHREFQWCRAYADRWAMKSTSGALRLAIRQMHAHVIHGKIPMENCR